MRNHKIIKNRPKEERPDFSFLPQNEDDLEFEIRQKMLNNWSSSHLDTQVMILEILSKNLLSPQDVGNLCVGNNEKNLLVPLMRLSHTALLISKTDLYTTIALVERTPDNTPCYFIVLDKLNTPLFPSKHLYQANLNNILNKSHISYDSLISPSLGTTVYLYPEEFVNKNAILYYGNIEIANFLRYVYFKPRSHLNISVNISPVSYTNIDSFDLEEISSNRDYKMFKAKLIDCFKTLIYRSAYLVYYETYETMPKRPRDSETIIIKLLNDSMISAITRQFKFSKNALYIFSDLQQPNLKRQKISD